MGRGGKHSRLLYPFTTQIIDARFTEHLNMNFKLLEEDGKESHRALMLQNLKPDLSGNYKCRVSGLSDEDFKQKNMIVYCEYDRAHPLSITAAMS